ncbi:hypothetical protein [Pectobacterium polaris]|uniref:hypothetical protein n=1 Tax=Pectobacterium polaris TaxID=2042057 RepID=UPI001CF2446A|nr:hypothetical protein [Pectobacterium polaris]MCA6951000.1 hypothetical protein [Pectobacterium polaris]
MMKTLLGNDANRVTSFQDKKVIFLSLHDQFKEIIYSLFLVFWEYFSFPWLRDAYPKNMAMAAASATRAIKANAILMALIMKGNAITAIPSMAALMQGLVDSRRAKPKTAKIIARQPNTDVAAITNRSSLNEDCCGGVGAAFPINLSNVVSRMETIFSAIRSSIGTSGVDGPTQK